MSIVNNICEQVSEFNYLFGVISYDYKKEKRTFYELFDSKSNEFNEKQVLLRYSLIHEEIKELVDAINTKNSIEIVDALCDILYVVAGAKVYFNLTNDNIEAQINPEFINEIKNFKSEINSQKIIVMLENLTDSTDLLNFLTLLKDICEQNKLLEIHTNSITHGVFTKEEIVNLALDYNNCLDKIIIFIFEMSKCLEINIDELFTIVHKSNMSKVCEDMDTALETVNWYKSNETRYKEPNYREIIYNDKKYWVIYDEETKKILKSVKYNQVNFTLV